MINHIIVLNIGLRGRVIVNPKFPENKLMAYTMKNMKYDTVGAWSYIQKYNWRKRQHLYHKQINIWPLTVLSWYSHFSKKCYRVGSNLPSSISLQLSNKFLRIWFEFASFIRDGDRDDCNFHMICIDDIIPNWIHVIFWTWKWCIESSRIKWNKH